MGSKSSARLLITAVVGLLTTCCLPSVQLPIPVRQVPVTPIAELDPPALQGYVASEPERTLYNVITLFSEKKALAHFDRSPDALRLVSAYTEEPQDGETFRRIAYAVKIQPILLQPECSWVEIRWFLESRPFEGLDWRPTLEPEDYRPLWANDLDRFLREHSCR